MLNSLKLKFCVRTFCRLIQKKEITLKQVPDELKQFVIDEYKNWIGEELYE